MPESINSKLKEQYDHDDSGGSLDTNLGDFLDSEGASGTSNNSKWRDWASGTGTSLNTRLFHKHGGSGSFMTRWKNWIAFSSTHSFNFDGSNDYLNCGLIDITVHTNATMACWIKLDNFDSTYMFAGCHNSKRFYFGITNGKVPFYGVANAVGDGGSALTINAGEWNHFALVANGGTATFYMNGIAKDTVSYTQSSATNPDHPFIVGARNDGGTGAVSIANPVDGCIDEFAIWDVALSSSDITSVYNNGKVIDLSKSASYGTDRTGNLKLWLRCGDKAEPESTTAIARQDFYTDFDGSNDYVDTGATFQSTFRDSFSFSMWVKPNDGTPASLEMFGGARDGTGDDSKVYLILQTNGKLQIQYESEGDSASPTTSSAVFPNGVCEWTHLAWVADNSADEIYIYVNGEVQALDASNNLNGVTMSNYTSTIDFVIGAGSNVGTIDYFLDGAISNLSLYQTALDAQTIKQFAKSRFTPMRDNRFSVVDFDGSNDYINTNSTFQSVFQSAFTITAWIKPDDGQPSGINALFGSDSTSDQDRFRVMLKTDGKIGILYKSNGAGSEMDDDSTSAVFSDGATDWTHIAVTITESSGTVTGTVYINGSSIAGSFSGSADMSAFETTTNFAIGGANRAGSLTQHFDGAISSVAVYNTAKSAEEIYAIYQQGITYDESSLSGLQGYWRMGDDTSKAFPTIADSSSNSNDGTITNGASDDIVQQMVAGYDMGAFEGTEELGTNLVTNGTFDSDITGWSLSNPDSERTISHATIGGRTCVDISDQSTSNRSEARFDCGSSLEDGAVYKLCYYVRKSQADSTNKYYIINLGMDYIHNTGATFDNAVLEWDTWEYRETYIVAQTSNNFLQFMATSTGTGLNNAHIGRLFLDDVKLQKVLQSEVSDTHPAIIDVNEPVLGVAVYTDPFDSTANGTDVITLSEWSAYNTPTSRNIEDGALKIVAVGGAKGALLTIGSLTATTIYKFTCDVTGDLGARSIYFGGKDDVSTVSGKATYYFTGVTSQLIYFRSANNSTGTTFFSNINISPVSGNVGTMTNQDSADLVYSSVLPDQSFLTGVNSAYNFVSLDGTNDYIKNESYTAHQQDTGTISVWVKFGDISGYQYVVGVGGNTSTGTNRVITLLNENLRFSGYSADFDTGADVSADTWYHIVLIWNGTSVTFYLDGTAYTNTQSNLVTPTGTNFVVGAYPAGFSTPTNGDFGTVAHWNKVLTSTEVNAIKDLGRHGNLLDSYSDNLKLCYSMSGLDAKTGFSDTATTIYDRSGNSNHGTTVSIASADLKSSPNAEPNGYAKGDTNRSTTTP